LISLQNTLRGSNQTQQLTLYGQIAETFAVMEEFDSAAVYLEKALIGYKQPGDKKQIANKLHRLSLKCFKLRQFDESLEHDFKGVRF